MGNLLYAASCRSRRSHGHRLWTGAAYPVVGLIVAETVPAMATSRTRLPKPCGASSWSQRRRSPLRVARSQACAGLDLSQGRGAFEGTLADEDREGDPDRWCSLTPCGQEFWQIVW